VIGHLLFNSSFVGTLDYKANRFDRKSKISIFISEWALWLAAFKKAKL
jgi:hypothetical protein